MNDVEAEAVRLALLRSLPAGWGKAERETYIVGIMVGARAPTMIGKRVEAMVAHISGGPTEFLESRIRTIIGVIRGESTVG